MLLFRDHGSSEQKLIITASRRRRRRLRRRSRRLPMTMEDILIEGAFGTSHSGWIQAS
jgi:hypothetical protein